MTVDGVENLGLLGSDIDAFFSHGSNSDWVDLVVVGEELGWRGSLPVAAVAASLGCGNQIAVAELREGETVLDLGSGGGSRSGPAAGSPTSLASPAADGWPTC
jgi:hypothetical protein